MGLPRFRYSSSKSNIIDDKDGQDRDFYLDTAEHKLYVSDDEHKKYLLNDSGFEAVYGSDGKPTGSIVQKVYKDDGSYIVSDTTRNNQVILGDASLENVDSGYSSLNFIIGESGTHSESGGNRVTFGIQCREQVQDCYPRLIFDNKELFKANHTLRDPDNNGLAIGEPLKKLLVDLIYPVGSIYISYPVVNDEDYTLKDECDPNYLWGGKWELLDFATYLRAGQFDGAGVRSDSIVGSFNGANEKNIYLKHLPDHAHKLAAWGVGVKSMDTTGDPEEAAFYIPTQRSPMWKTIINSQLTTTNAVGSIESEYREADNSDALHGAGEYLIETDFTLKNKQPFNVEPLHLNVAMWRRIS